MARVAVAPIARREVARTITAYGTAVAAPGQARIVSVPFECRVTAVPVTVGERVEAGAALVEIAPSPETALALDEARQEQTAAGEELALVEERLAQKLATRAERQQAEQRVRAAALRVESFERRGLGAASTLRASAAGVVSGVAVKPGEIASAGTAMVETIDAKQIVVRLGVERGDAASLVEGQRIELEPVDSGSPRPLDGTVVRVAQEVDATTRLVDVIVAPARGGALFLNEFVRARVRDQGRTALVVPRPALTPEGDAFVIYTIENGKAVRRPVTAGADDGDLVEITADGIAEGMQAVVSGNSQLEDGTLVEVGAPR